MTGAGEKAAAWTASPESGRGGGVAALIAIILIVAVWMSGWPIILSLALSWAISAAAVWISLWKKQRFSFRQGMLAAAVSAAAWACSAGCLLLMYGLMGVYPGGLWAMDERVFWGFAAFSVFNVIMLGLSVWFWLLGAALSGVVVGVGTKSVRQWLQEAASRVKVPSAWRHVPLVFGVTFVSVLVVQYHGAIFVRVLIGASVGWLYLRFLAELAQPSGKNPVFVKAAVFRRSKRWALLGVGLLFLLMALFYGALFISSGSTFSEIGWHLLTSILLGFLIALAAWLLAFAKPLYGLVMMMLSLATAMLFQLFLTILFARFM